MVRHKCVFTIMVSFFTSHRFVVTLRIHLLVQKYVNDSSCLLIINRWCTMMKFDYFIKILRNELHCFKTQEPFLNTHSSRTSKVLTETHANNHRYPLGQCYAPGRCVSLIRLVSLDALGANHSNEVSCCPATRGIGRPSLDTHAVFPFLRLTKDNYSS